MSKTKEVSPFRQWADRPGDAAISELCQHVAEGGHLAGFVKEHGFAYVTVLSWINREQSRQEMYARAREDRADVLADEIVAIADELNTVTRSDEDGSVEVVFDSTAVARNRLRVDARKWAAAKLKPRTYGEKVQQELTGKDGGPIEYRAANLSDDELARVIAQQAKLTK